MSPQTPLSSVHARIFAAYLSTVSILKELVDIGHIRVCINVVSNKGCFQPALCAVRILGRQEVAFHGAGHF